MNQHTACLEFLAHLDRFRKQFPTDHSRLLSEYCDLEPRGHQDDRIAELEADLEVIIDEKRQLDRDLDAMEDERDTAIEDLRAAERRIEELENTKEEENE